MKVFGNRYKKIPKNMKVFGNRYKTRLTPYII